MVVRATVNMNQPKPRFPTVVTATVFKPTPDTKAGIGFTIDDGRVRISTLSAGGLFFAQSDLRVGDICLSINDSADLPSNTEAAQAVRHAVGEVTITVARGSWSPDIVLATVPKESVGTKTGVVFAESPAGAVRIRRTVPGSLFERTALQGGDIVHSVNGIAADDVAQAANLVRAAKGAVTILAFSLTKARIQAVEFAFHRNYDIDWISAEECEVSLSRPVGAAPHAKFILLFSSDHNMATYLDVSKGPFGTDSNVRRETKVAFAKKLLLVNDILADARDVVAAAVLCTTPAVPVLAELIEEPQTESHDTFLKDLERLANLRREGLLNEAEFDTAKARLLQG